MQLSFVFSAVLAPHSEWPFVWFPLAGQRHAIDVQWPDLVLP